MLGERGIGSAASLQATLAEADPNLASRLRVLDGAGVAVADSAGEAGVGIDYSERTEIQEALAGRYGASTRIGEDEAFTMYVAYPIRSGGQIIGAAYTSAPTLSVTLLLREYRLQLGWALAAFLLATLVLAELMSRWLSRPLRYLERGTAAFAAGDFAVRVEPVGARETRAVAVAFNTMADEVERVVSELKNEERRKSRFVSDVSHELRTPLTAIRGAAETLLDGDVAPADSERFLSTIVRESDRLARLANDLLALQRMEGATGELPVRRLDLAEVARRAAPGSSLCSSSGARPSRSPARPRRSSATPIASSRSSPISSTTPAVSRSRAPCASSSAPRVTEPCFRCSTRARVSPRQTSRGCSTASTARRRVATARAAAQGWGSRSSRRS
jgi:HAMP domain-containing protein